jgi:hypothetical protein
MGCTKFRETELLKKGYAFLRLSFPARKKVTKEARFVRAELPPETGSKEMVTGRQQALTPLAGL